MQLGTKRASFDVPEEGSPKAKGPKSGPMAKTKVALDQAIRQIQPQAQKPEEPTTKVIKTATKSERQTRLEDGLREELNLLTSDAIRQRYIDKFGTDKIISGGDSPTKITSKKLNKLNVIDMYIEMSARKNRLVPDKNELEEERLRKVELSSAAAKSRATSRGPLPPTYPDPAFPPATSRGRSRSKSKGPPAPSKPSKK
jgi:hypothetical protein